jgi:hypothetical protein
MWFAWGFKQRFALFAGDLLPDPLPLRVPAAAALSTPALAQEDPATQGAKV